MASFDSTYDSRRRSAVSASANGAPNFQASLLSDVEFSRLFQSPTSPPPDLQLFADGLPPADDNDAGEGSDAFSFDQMVDLDACQPPPAEDELQTFQVHQNSSQDFDDFITHKDENTDTTGNYFIEHFTATETGGPHQHAATSSALQPGPGAPS